MQMYPLSEHLSKKKNFFFSEMIMCPLCPHLHLRCTYLMSILIGPGRKDGHEIANFNLTFSLFYMYNKYVVIKNTKLYLQHTY